MKLLELIKAQEKSLLKADRLLESLKNSDDELIKELTTLRLPLIMVMIENSYAHKTTWAKPYLLAYFQDLQKLSYLEQVDLKLELIFEEIETLF